MLIKFWREITIIALLFAAIIFFGMWRYESLEHKQTKADLETAQNAIKTHEENIKLAEKVNYDHQSNIDRLNADIKRLRRNPPRCIAVTNPASIHSEQESRREYAAKNGISSQWLYDYGGDAEQIRIERNSCIDFVNGIYENRENTKNRSHR